MDDISEFRLDELGNIHYTRNSDNLIKIAVDGHPRQGNQYIRLLLLNSFPKIDIPEPLSHKTKNIQKQIDQGLIVFMTLREPLGCMTSLISDLLYSTNWQFKPSTQLFQKYTYQEYGYKYIEEKFMHYIKMTQFLIRNKDNIFIIDFETIKKLSEYDLAQCMGRCMGHTEKPQPTKAYEKINSTSRTEILSYLSSNKFSRVLELAGNIYDKAMYDCEDRLVISDRY